MAAPGDSLREIISREVGSAPAPAISAIAEAARLRHGEGILAVVFYGSVRRDHVDEGRIVDLYLLADSYRSLHAGWFARRMNAALPPNVYYLEVPFEGRRVRAKYNLMTLEQFERAMRPETFQSYFWARFAQPSSLVWARDEEVRARVVGALAQAVETLVAAAWPLFARPPTPEAFWCRAFSETYSSELRAERKGRAEQIYRTYAERYDRLLERVAHPAPAGAAGQGRARRAWFGRRVLGKTLSVLRLLKAAFTFQNGADYLAWKIGRHAGLEIELTPWQRRHPILAAPFLFWRLYLRGAIR